MNLLFEQPSWVLAIIAGVIILAEWLVKKTWLRHLSTALLVIVLGAILANLGVIPSASSQYPMYSGIFTYLAPLSIFFLLLEVNLKSLRQAGLPMLILFSVGAVGTVLGVLLGMQVIDGAAVFGDAYQALGGMFTGTYTGGSANFNAVALHYGIMEQGTLYAGSAAVDNIITAIWMILSLGLPRLLHLRFPRKLPEIPAKAQQTIDQHQERATLDPASLSILIGLGLGTIWVSDFFAGVLGNLGWEIPSVLILTTIALGLAQFSWVQRLSGSRLLGMMSIYIFLTVIGAYCEIAALLEMWEIALAILGLVSILLLVHSSLIYGVGALLKYDWAMISIASQANIGGSSTALALAKSLDRPTLMLPAILIGSLGNGVGTYLGFLLAAQWL
ncbi:MAG: DUF819 family protein [Bacteroidota bacterium]